MAKKFLKALSYIQQGAQIYAGVKSAQADAKMTEAFEKGNATNPEGAQGGKSKPEFKPDLQRSSGSGTKNPGNSPLNTKVRDVNSNNFFTKA